MARSQLDADRRQAARAQLNGNTAAAVGLDFTDAECAADVTRLIGKSLHLVPVQTA